MHQSVQHSKVKSKPLRVKICGLTQGSQARAIAQLGADALGFICVPESPRYLDALAIRDIVQTLPSFSLKGSCLAKIGVFADATLDQITSTVKIAQLTGIQLHGQEPPEFCQAVRYALPTIELIKAFRVRSAETLSETGAYTDAVDALLLDAYTPKALGGTGEVWNWALVDRFAPACFWFLAGGLTPANVSVALRQACPPGIDLSSGVERSPGDKDLQLVQQLFCQSLC